MEAATPVPIGDENFIRDFLEVRKEALLETLEKYFEAATIATATLPVAQTYNCILRTCISRIVGYLIRVTPPRMAEAFARDMDGALAQTIKAIFRVEDMEGWQEELLFHPAQRG